MNFEPAGVRYGIPAVGLPLARPYGGRIVGANGLTISTPCPHKLASERLVSTTAGLLPVVGLDFRGPWQVGYASLARVSPAGIATLPDGSHVQVAGIGPTGSYAPFSLPYRRAPWPDPLRGGHPAHHVGDPFTTPVSLDDAAPVADPVTLNATGALPKVLVPTANDMGQILGPAGTSPDSAVPGGVLGHAQIDTGLPPLEDTWDNVKNSPLGVALPKILPSWGQLSTLLVCVLVAVGVWFLWPILSGLRRVGV